MSVCSKLLELLRRLIRNLDGEKVEPSGGGLSERVKQFFWPVRNLQYDIGFDCESLLPARDCAERLLEDWSFLNMCVDLMLGWRDENGLQILMMNSDGDIISKIEVVGEEIVKILGKYAARKKELRHFVSCDELLKELGDCQRKTDEDLKAEIEEALKHSSGPKIPLHHPVSNFWPQFMGCVTGNLRQIQPQIQESEEDCLKQQVSNLRFELECIEKYCCYRQVVCLNYYVAYVIATIAHRACSFWFNGRRRTDPETARILLTGIVSLHPEIDPSIPKVIKRNLNLRFGAGEMMYNICNYLLAWEDEEDLKLQLPSLLKFLSSETLKNGESTAALDDVKPSSFEEIYAVLGETAFLHRPMLRYRDKLYRAEILPRRSDLFAKICLLNAELSLKEQLKVSGPGVLSREGFLSKMEGNAFLENLRSLSINPRWKHKTEYMEQSLVLSKELADEFQSLCASLHFRRITDSLVKHSLNQLLFKIVFFKAESFLEVLSKISDPSIDPVTGQIDFLVQKLKYFKLIVTTKPVLNSPDEEVILALIEAFAHRITLLSYSFLPTDDILKKIVASLPHLLDSVEVIMAKFQEISAHFPNSCFPRTFQVGFIDSLCRKIKELLKYDPKQIAPVKPHIKVVQHYLVSWKSFLLKLSRSDVEEGKWNDLGNRIMNVAYKLEYVSESIEVEAHLQHSILLCDLLEDIRLVNQEISLIHELSYASKLQYVPQVAGEVMTQKNTPAINEMEVDLVDEEKVIIGRLTGGLPHRDVVSIVGMPGSGKTTLAKKVYNDRNVACHFRRRAWCTVSQVYSRRDLLLEIISDIHGLTDEIHRMSDDDLQSKMRRCLLRNKYLIVMDDVWDIAAWNDLQNVFPDDKNGSRILITSRLREVALKTNPASDPHPIRLLSGDESWMLLEKKIFKGDACPPELLHIGKEIAHHCQGLPLAIVAVAGLLRQTGQTRDLWERISNSLSSYIYDDPKSQCKKVLELSYKHLPPHLKPCFLYLGVFLEDKDIPVRKLIQVWTAEGFIWEAESQCLENVAEDCLMDLINRSLLTISKRRSNGKVKACRLHDLLRDLCHRKAKEENFLHLVTRNDEPYASYPDSDYGMEFEDDRKSAPLTLESYRLSIYLKRSHFFDSRPSGPTTRSLVFFAHMDSEPRCPYDISFIFQNFKLLRVLDLECINMGVNFPVEIGLMVQLRYLAISGYVNSIPLSISNLWKLETLVVKGLRGKVILPETIWRMARLRHLQVNNHVSFCFAADEDDEEVVGSADEDDKEVVGSAVEDDEEVVGSADEDDEEVVGSADEDDEEVFGSAVEDDEEVVGSAVEDDEEVVGSAVEDDEEVVGSSFHLDNLVSLSTPSLSCGKETEKILRRLPNLRKLRCIWYSSKDCKEFPNLESLTYLDSLKIIYHGIALDSGRFVLPSNLKKLTLSSFHLPWDHVSSIGSLPNLRVLKLLDGAFEGERWEMREEFKELQFLELNTLNIVEWNATSDHLPHLERLVLRNCKDLEEIPFELAGISTLQMIEVQWCKQSVEESAKEIGDFTGEIKVLITHS